MQDEMDAQCLVEQPLRVLIEAPHERQARALPAGLHREVAREVRDLGEGVRAAAAGQCARARGRRECAKKVQEETERRTSCWSSSVAARSSRR